MTTSTVTQLTAGTWSLDDAHSDVAIKVRHMAVGKVKGSFRATSGTLTVGDDGLVGAQATASIDAASVNTGKAERDGHIRSADFLDVEKYPTIEFSSTAVRDFDGETFTLVGDLTLHGVTKSVELEAEFLGETVDAYGLTRTGFSAQVTISRKEFGIDIEMGFGAGNAVVGDKIEISIETEWVRNAE